jgi:hypothetical protein
MAESIEHCAKKHADWFANTLRDIIRVVYETAFLHGAKHQKRLQQGED